MKVLFSIVILAVAVVAIPLDTNNDDADETGWFVPQPDGTLNWVDIAEGASLLAQATLDSKAQAGRSSSDSIAKYFLYTKSNPKEAQQITRSKKSIESSNFKAKHQTKVIIHGWNGDENSELNVKIRDAWLNRGKYNIIVVQWQSAQALFYSTAAAAVPEVGKDVAKMLNYLNKHFELQFGDVELIGVSLGAHIAGHAAKQSKAQIFSIVGLDPALPLFTYKDKENRLNSSDAYYVETIQTNGGQLGFLRPIGKTAYYPNGGKTQPNCGDDVYGECAHGRAWIYYVEAINRNDFLTIKCSNYQKAVKNDCGWAYSNVRMSAITNAYSVEGVYYVPIHDAAPYGIA